MHEKQLPRYLRTIVVLGVILWVAQSGCTSDHPLPTVPDDGSNELLERSEDAVAKSAPTPPSGVVTVGFGGEDLTFWPYTGANFDETPVDPINLIFANRADPLEIRAALLALDGDRTAFGFPDVYPFNATWSDAIGDVQTSYADGDGWLGSVVQLELGAYDPVRWHLRLFRTGDPYAEGIWTIGAVHFEVLIPGTADHQVLSWERAEEMALVDFLRSDLLDPTQPFVQTGVINAEPSFRAIPAIIYNGLPDELKVYVGGPLGQVTDPVPIPTDGRATVLNLADAAPITAGTETQSFVMTYQQVVPKPFCDDDQSQWVLVVGPVEFQKTVVVTPIGRYIYDASYSGTLTVTPWNIEHNQPLGEPYSADVNGDQHGHIRTNLSQVGAIDKRIADQAGGGEQLMTWLRVASPGLKSYRVRTHCQ